jgi:hypothetical protein
VWVSGISWRRAYDCLSLRGLRTKQGLDLVATAYIPSIYMLHVLQPAFLLIETAIRHPLHICYEVLQRYKPRRDAAQRTIDITPPRVPGSSINVPLPGAWGGVLSCPQVYPKRRRLLPIKTPPGRQAARPLPPDLFVLPRPIVGLHGISTYVDLACKHISGLIP